MEILGEESQGLGPIQFALPWANSRYSWKVAKTPKREAHEIFEKEVNLEEVMIENYVGDTLIAIERITRLTLIDRDNFNELRILVPKRKHDDGPILMGKLARMVADQDKKNEVMELLRFKKDNIILKIKESPEYEGRLYFNEYYDCEFYDPFDRMKQEFEAARVYLKWLDIVIEELTVAQPTAAPRPVAHDVSEKLVVNAGPVKGDAKTKVKEQDLKLKHKLDNDQVKEYFMQLSKFYEKSDVLNFIHTNFEGFDASIDTNKCVCFPKSQEVKPGWVRRLVYDFWYHAADGASQDRYVQLVLDNFEMFDADPGVFKKSFARAAPRDYPFSCKNLR